MPGFTGHVQFKSATAKKTLTWLLIIGLILVIGGLSGILYCLFCAWRIRFGNLPDLEARNRLGRLNVVNLISFLIAIIGAMPILFALIF